MKLQTFIKKYLLGISFLFIFSGLFLSLQVSAQSDIGPLNMPTGITEQTQNLQTNQTTIRELEDKISELSLEETTIENEINDLEVREAEIIVRNELLRENLIRINNEVEQNLSKIEEIRKTLESNQSNSVVVFNIQKESLESTIENLNNESADITKEIEDRSIELTQIQAILTQKRTELEGIIAEKSKISSSLNDRRQELDLQVDSLQSSILDEARFWIFYLAVLVLYWLIFRSSLVIIKAIFKTPTYVRFVKAITTVIWLIITLITILYAFVQRIEILEQAWAGIVLISWGIAWGLKDFFASFMAFTLLAVSREYIVGDIVKINEKLGKVIKIGLFNTYIKEIMDKPDLKEIYSGQIVSLPNNLIMNYPVVNYTKTNKIIWHSFRLVFTQESDLQLVRKKITKIFKEEFEWLLDHKDEFLDNVYNLDTIYRPRVSLVPHNLGPAFTVEFPIRFGAYNRVVDRLTEKLYSEFNKKNKDLVNMESLN